ncbi:MAG: efflux RND transporter permease subunit [Bdellovibrionales bacterium]
MNFFKGIHNQKLSMHYLSIVIVIAGAMTFAVIQREARPNVNFNRVAITAVYPGASPADIEELVIDPIEEKISEVDGVEEFRSVSYVGAGSISVKIDDTYPNPQEIIDEVRRKIAEVKDLPAEVEDPTVVEAKASNIPVLNLALYGDVSAFDFKLETEKLRDFLKLQDGVQSVEYTGISDLQLKIKTDPKKLDRFDITLDEIANKVTGWAKQKPGGLFENSEKVANLTIGEDLNELDELGQFVVRSNDSGNKVRLADISEIKYDLESLQTGKIYGEQDAVLFTVVKKPFHDAIDVVDNLKDSIDGYAESLPENLKLKLYKNQSINIRNKLRIVTNNAVGGLILVLAFCFYFWTGRSSLVTAVGIPIAILGGITLVYL